WCGSPPRLWPRWTPREVAPDGSAPHRSAAPTGLATPRPVRRAAGGQLRPPDAPRLPAAGPRTVLPLSGSGPPDGYGTVGRLGPLRPLGAHARPGPATPLPRRRPSAPRRRAPAGGGRGRQGRPGRRPLPCAGGGPSLASSPTDDRDRRRRHGAAGDRRPGHRDLPPGPP